MKEVVISLYVGVGLLLSSGLHTYYTKDFYEKVRFGLPMLANPDIELPRQAGYLGSVLAGIVGGSIFYVYQIIYLPNLQRQNVQLLLVGEFPNYILVLTAIILGSQIIGGASWSKFFLDGVLLLLSFMIITSFVYAFPFLTTVSLFMVSLGSLLAGGWKIWSREFVKPRVEESENVQLATNSLVFPHFPSFAYFITCSLYNVCGFFAILIEYWNFQT